MDERILAGRHHLTTGEQALAKRTWDEGRSHFEAALIQFRGPDLRIGEAHALRGLARVHLGQGGLIEAETHARLALVAYTAVQQDLARLGAWHSAELVQEASEGGVASHILLFEVLLRGGRFEEARSEVEAAQEAYEGSGNPAAAARIWSAVGRMAMREGQYDEAGHAFSKAMTILQHGGDEGGQAGTLLALGELWRLRGSLDESELLYRRVLPLAERVRDAGLQARALSALGSLMLQKLRLDEARAYYRDALPLARNAGDVELEAFASLGLGEVDSRAARGQSIDLFVDAARAFARLGHHHGMGTAMLRIAQHALRLGKPDLALAAAASSHRLWRNVDPVRGVGQAMRIEVKALAALKQWPPTMVATWARAALAGELQPNAIEVREHYRKRAPKELVAQLDKLTTDELMARTDALVGRTVAGILAQNSLEAGNVETVPGALLIAEAIVAQLPRAGAPAELPREVEAYPDLPEDALSEAPPEDVGPALVHVPGVTPTVRPPPVRTKGPPANLTPPKAPVARPEATATAEIGATPEDDGGPAAPPPEGYVGLYEPPAEAPVADDEELPESVKRLQDKAPPSEYASLYSLDEDDQE